ncbi:DUF5677 domain-containing protein [Microbacterium trichothecenolyticum]|uniref:Uncharacterized protein n=1 Tax=Microbacterium trichothecenolyticum TaxID=69370 RepID=A0ABU0TZ00_MICTR|nr:DUF5677 domain-containing protein [Microbacterium trichothecenolyticum]MDQ1124882.1 hypothetical protein [Microbacterium trichothecenolyticum]
MSDKWPDGAVETQRLVTLWEQLSSRTFTPKDGMQPSNAVQVWTFAHHASRLSRAVLALHQAGHDLEAMPLIRQTMECAMNAAWLLLTDDGGAALSAVDTKSRRTMFTEVTNLGLADLTELRDQLDAEEARNTQTVTHTRSFEERCRAIAGGAQIYAMYRTLSLYSHATSSVADVYLRSDPEDAKNPYGVSLLWRGDWDGAEDWLRVQALMLLLSQIAADDAQDKPMHRTQLKKARQRLGVEWEIRRADNE